MYQRVSLGAVSVSEVDKQVGLPEGESVVVVLDAQDGGGHYVAVALFSLHFYVGTSGSAVDSEECRVIQELSLLCVLHTHQMVGDEREPAVAYNYRI